MDVHCCIEHCNAKLLMTLIMHPCMRILNILLAKLLMTLIMHPCMRILNIFLAIHRLLMIIFYDLLHLHICKLIYSFCKHNATCMHVGLNRAHLPFPRQQPEFLGAATVQRQPGQMHRLSAQPIPSLAPAGARFAAMAGFSSLCN